MYTSALYIHAVLRYYLSFCFHFQALPKDKLDSIVSITVLYAVFPFEKFVIAHSYTHTRSYTHTHTHTHACTHIHTLTLTHVHVHIHSHTYTCIGFESYLRQLIFLRKSDCLGCAVLLCLVVCLTCLLLPSFLLISH